MSKSAFPKTYRITLWWAVVVGTAVALIAGQGALTRKAILLLSFPGALAGIVVAWEHGWLKTRVKSIGIPLLSFITMAILSCLAWPRLESKPPELSILGYEVVLFKPNYSPFANVFFQNIGGAGKIAVYSYAGLTSLNADEHVIRKELENDVRKLVSEGGGLVFSVKPQEKRWFTVNGPSLSTDQARLLREGKLKMFFAGKIVVNGGGPQDYSFCNFVLGDKPNVVLGRPED